MTKPVRAFFTILLLTSFSFAQSTQTATQQPQTSSPGGARSLTTQQEADLAEASRLSTEVVKFYREGKYDEALPRAKRALEIRERVLGADAFDVAAALVNLAEVQLARKKYSEALTMYQRVLPIYEKTFGPVSDKTGQVVNSLAFLRYVNGDFDESERLYQRAVSIRESGPGNERRELAQALHKLAEFYRSRKEYKKAEPLFLRAIAINDKVTARDDPDRASTIQSYICFLYESHTNIGSAQEAEKQFFESRKDKTRPEPSSADRGGVLNGKAIRLPQPIYPDEARKLLVPGIVRIEVLIDETGKVLKATVLCGHPVFAKPAVEAAYKARFSPTKLSGKPVKVNGIILYNFEIR